MKRLKMIVKEIYLNSLFQLIRSILVKYILDRILEKILNLWTVLYEISTHTELFSQIF